jgi:biopolymer transport protein ExbD
MRFKSKIVRDEEIPSSSMADIAFLLIIFFMVTTVFAARKGLNMRFPKDDPNEQIQESDIKATYIRIQPEGSLVVNRSPMTVDEMKAYILERMEINPMLFVIVHPKEKAKFGAVIEVLDALRQIRVVNISLPTKKEVEGWGNIEGLTDI